MVQERLLATFERLASIAEKLQKAVLYWLFLCGGAIALLAFKAFSIESVWWWNVFKIGFIVAPLVVWCFIWLALSQLSRSPSSVKQLLDDKDEIWQQVSEQELSQVASASGAFGLAKTLYRQEGLSEIVETIGSVGLLFNPLFLLVAAVASVLLFFSIISAGLVLLI